MSDGLDAPRLRDGIDRDRPDASHAWTGLPGHSLEYRWNEAIPIAQARLVFDSNLNNDKRMPCSYPQKGNRCAIPTSLVKAYRIEAKDASGQWAVVHRETANYQRLVRVPLGIQTTALRFIPEETWGDAEVRVFAFEPLATCEPDLPTAPDGPHFREVQARIAPEHLAPPENSPEGPSRTRHGA